MNGVLCVGLTTAWGRMEGGTEDFFFLSFFFLSVASEVLSYRACKHLASLEVYVCGLVVLNEVHYSRIFFSHGGVTS